MIRLGNASRWNVSFELIACSMPGISGIRGRAPVAISIFSAVTSRPPASFRELGPVKTARSRKIVTS